MEALYKARKPFDWVIFLPTVALMIIGLVNLYSISRVSAAHNSLFIQQLGVYAVGLVVVIVAARIDLSWLRRYAWVIYGVLLLALMAVLVQGKRTNGASRWLQLGALQLQPSEFIKISLVLVYARLFSGDAFDMEFRPLPYALAWQAIWVVPFFLILKQPDGGTAIIGALIAFTLFFFIRLRPTVKVAVFLFNAVAVTIRLAVFGLDKYQKKRWEDFWHPEADPTGGAFHAKKALLAIRSGGLWGKGFMHSGHVRSLSESWSDFPFAVWAEEWGFVGCMVMLSLYLLLLLWLLRLVNEVRDRFAKNVVLGCAALLFWHVLLNLSMVLGLLPVVGVPLLLVSHGGSSAFTILVALALCLNISMRRHAETTTTA